MTFNDATMPHTRLKKLPETRPALVLAVNKNEIVLDNNWLMSSLGVEKDDDELFASIISHHSLERPYITRQYRLSKGVVP